MFVILVDKLLIFFLEVVINDLFLQVAKMLGGEYLFLGLTLGLSQNAIKEIEKDNKKCRDVILEVLNKWRESSEECSTAYNIMEKLISVMKSLERNDIAAMIRVGECSVGPFHC